MLDARQYIYQATSKVNGGTVTIGYPYSLLEWCAEPHSSWSLPVDVRRVPSTQTAQEVGAEQIQALANARTAYLEAWSTLCLQRARDLGTPDEAIELEDPCSGPVCLERWNSLHEKKGSDVPYYVIWACVHLERSQPPAALWLAWLSPDSPPGTITVTLETIWRAYFSRWPVEPVIHFRK